MQVAVVAICLFFYEITDKIKIPFFQPNSPFSSRKTLQHDKKNYDDEDNWSVASSYPKFGHFDGLLLTKQVLRALEPSLI